MRHDRVEVFQLYRGSPPIREPLLRVYATLTEKQAGTTRRFRPRPAELELLLGALDGQLEKALAVELDMRQTALLVALRNMGFRLGTGTNSLLLIMAACAYHLRLSSLCARYHRLGRTSYLVSIPCPRPVEDDELSDIEVLVGLLTLEGYEPDAISRMLALPVSDIARYLRHVQSAIGDDKRMSLLSRVISLASSGSRAPIRSRRNQQQSGEPFVRPSVP